MAALRATFRRYELRDPLRRLEEVDRATCRRRGRARRRRRARAVARRSRRVALAARVAGRARSRSPCARRRSPRARCSPSRRHVALRRGDGRRRGLRRRLRGTGGGGRGARRAPGRSPTTRRRSASSRRARVRHDARPPTCSTRPAAATRSASCARTAASIPGSRTARAWEAVAVARARRRAAPRARGARPDDAAARRRAAARRGAALDGGRRDHARPRAPRRDHDARAEEVAALERSIYAAAGEEFLIGSPQQLGAILFEKLELSRKRRGKTGYSTDARVLAAIRAEHEIVPLIERWRELSTLVKTYLEPLPGLVDEQSRLHTTFLQTVAATGRLSSVNPNLQNVPIRSALGREIRGCFVAGAGAAAGRRRLLAGRAARARADRRRAGAEGDLPPRRGRPHRDRLPGVRRRARRARRRACARRRR